MAKLLGGKRMNSTRNIDVLKIAAAIEKDAAAPSLDCAKLYSKLRLKM